MTEGNVIKRQIVSSKYEGLRYDTDGYAHDVSGYINGIYTDHKLNIVLQNRNPGWTYEAHVTSMKVIEYRMSLDDFVKYATPRE